MQGLGRRASIACAWMAVALVLSGCTNPRTPAPVEDRSGLSRPPASAGTPAISGTTVPPITTDANGKPLPGIENYGKPGYYAVRPGDTIMRIGLETGQNWRDIVKWNNLENANLIEVGQVLRVIPPVGGVPATGTTAPAVAGASGSSNTAVATTNGSGTQSSTATPPAAVAAAPAAAAAASGSTPAKPSTPASGDDDLGWIWPAQGQLIAGFDEAKNKGLDIGGRAGDAVLAAADGRVVYAGAGLRGYGNLIILKHNNTYLTAYAHNQALLVKEDQSVQKGQKIAEMGNSDADRVKLHFEIRRQGKPVDPARYLPSR